MDSPPLSVIGRRSSSDRCSDRALPACGAEAAGVMVIVLPSCSGHPAFRDPYPRDHLVTNGGRSQRPSYLGTHPDIVTTLAWLNERTVTCCGTPRPGQADTAGRRPAPAAGSPGATGLCQAPALAAAMV